MKPFSIDINVDVGEGINNESQLFPYITSCNIACGGHAGDDTSMRTVVKLAKFYGVRIGAHPSFPDKENFGRKVFDISNRKLYKSIKEQINKLLKILREESLQLYHIKPHGALYNLAASHKETAMVIIEVLKSIKEPVYLYVPYGSVIASLAIQEKVPIKYEAFADRNYNDDLTLVPRKEPSAIITNSDVMVKHVLGVIKNQNVRSISGKEIYLEAETFCIHSDNPNAVTMVKTLTEKLYQNNVIVQQFLTDFKLTYKRLGERAILIEWPSEIEEGILKNLLYFKKCIEEKNLKKVEDVRSAYNSLLIIYNEVIIDFQNEVLKLEKIYSSHIKKDKLSSTLWKIPVCYSKEFALDLEEISKVKRTEVKELIRLHTETIYTVYFIGFLPGFLYLGGLKELLHHPRKATPRLKVEKGAVAIGNGQTGVYPSESPGGWNIIGNSPIDFFNINNEEACFAKPGDSIKFYEVSMRQYNSIKALVEAGVYQLESEVIGD